VPDLDSAVVRVLVVDDQAPFREAARSVLEVLPGFELVGEADSGEGAVSVAADLEPDLVLMDVHMPGIGGLEAARRIVVAQPGAVVILVSSYRAQDVTAAIDDSGALGFLPKERFGARALSELWKARTERLPPRDRREQLSPGD
jgi:two-component system, NarL family, invasion response regulator UvrY